MSDEALLFYATAPGIGLRGNNPKCRKLLKPYILQDISNGSRGQEGGRNGIQPRI